MGSFKFDMKCEKKLFLFFLGRELLPYFSLISSTAFSESPDCESLRGNVSFIFLAALIVVCILPEE